MNNLLDIFFHFCYKSEQYDLKNISYFLSVYSQFLKRYNLNKDFVLRVEQLELESKIKISDWETLDELFAIPQVFKDSFMELYPKTCIIKGAYYPLFTGDIDSLCDEYAEKIGYSMAIHLEVLELIDWGIKNNAMNIGFTKFVQSYYWLTLKEIAKTGDQTIVNDLINDI